ncbi:MAG: hypothetical protein EBU80_10865 [Chitinophagia bacterium]|nr:hypothetical protein [Chitinophagia bacterium]
MNKSSDNFLFDPQSQQKIEELVSIAKDQGYITYEEINDVLPMTFDSPDTIDQVLIGIFSSWNKLANADPEIIAVRRFVHLSRFILLPIVEVADHSDATFTGGIQYEVGCGVSRQIRDAFTNACWNRCNAGWTGHEKLYTVFYHIRWSKASFHQKLLLPPRIQRCIGTDAAGHCIGADNLSVVKNTQVCISIGCCTDGDIVANLFLNRNQCSGIVGI